MKYAKAISPDRRNATGRVNSPTRRSTPPNVSRTPAMPSSDAMGAVPPPGKMAAGNPTSFAVPTCMKRKAATIRRMLRRYGAQLDHLVTRFAAVMVRPSGRRIRGPENQDSLRAATRSSRRARSRALRVSEAAGRAATRGPRGGAGAAGARPWPAGAAGASPAPRRPARRGPSPRAGRTPAPPALCAEALRLGRIVAELAPADPEVHGLVAT